MGSASGIAYALMQTGPVRPCLAHPTGLAFAPAFFVLYTRMTKNPIRFISLYREFRSTQPRRNPLD